MNHDLRAFDGIVTGLAIAAVLWAAIGLVVVRWL